MVKFVTDQCFCLKVSSFEFFFFKIFISGKEGTPPECNSVIKI